MPRNLLAPALALLLANPFAMAQDAPPAPAASASHAQRDHARMMMGRRMHMEHDRDMGAFADLRALERLYREAGREKDMSGIYNEVLAKSQDPRLRTYAYHQLARLQAKPANVDQAAATLRKSLSENLANEAKMRAEHERMRAQWQDKAAQ
jgi:predicted negative regulator of RcsB-dependent stress response